MPRNSYQYGTSPRKYDIEYTTTAKQVKSKTKQKQVQTKPKELKNKTPKTEAKKNVQEGKIINKKPIIATKEEQEENSRSKSAKLRIFEKK